LLDNLDVAQQLLGPVFQLIVHQHLVVDPVISVLGGDGVHVEIGAQEFVGEIIQDQEEQEPNKYDHAKH